jgi:hypothetical protein
MFLLFLMQKQASPGRRSLGAKRVTNLTPKEKARFIPGFLNWSKDLKLMRDRFRVKRRNISASGTEHVMLKSSPEH